MFEEVISPMQLVVKLTRGIEQVDKTLSSQNPLTLKPLLEDILALRDDAKQIVQLLKEQAFLQEARGVITYFSEQNELDKDELFRCFIQDKKEGKPFAHAVLSASEVALKRWMLSTLDRLSGKDVLPFLMGHDELWNTIAHIIFKPSLVETDEFLVKTYFKCIERVSPVERRELFAIRNGEHETVGQLIMEGCDQKAKQMYAQYVTKPTQTQERSFKPLEAGALPPLVFPGSKASQAPLAPPATLAPKPTGAAPSMFHRRSKISNSLSEAIAEQQASSPEEYSII